MQSRNHTFQKGNTLNNICSKLCNGNHMWNNENSRFLRLEMEHDYVRPDGSVQVLDGKFFKGKKSKLAAFQTQYEHKYL